MRINPYGLLGVMVKNYIYKYIFETRGIVVQNNRIANDENIKFY